MRELSTLEEAKDEESRRDGEVGEEEGQPGLSLIWLSLLPPDRTDRACNQTNNTVSFSLDSK